MSGIRERQSPEYRKLRDELLEAESALKDQRERVAELRRRLPATTKVETDYVFREGPADLTRNAESDFFETRLSELFPDGMETVSRGRTALDIAASETDHELTKYLFLNSRLKKFFNN